MAITTLESVKMVLGIDGDDKDELIEMLIPLVADDYENIRGRPFGVDADGNTVYPPGANLTAIRMIGYHLAQQAEGGGLEGAAAGIASESLGDYSVSYGAGGAGGGRYGYYPESITGGIRRYVNFV